MDRPSIGSDGDTARQAEIDTLPEELVIAYGDGTIVKVPYRATVQAGDDDWRRFRDSPAGRELLGTLDERSDGNG